MSKVPAADAVQGTVGKCWRARPPGQGPPLMQKGLLQVLCLKNNTKEELKSISF